MMMKFLALIVLLLAVFNSASARKQNVHFDFCPTCVDFLNKDLGDLEKILSGGVLGSCSKVCSLLPAQSEQAICDLLCSIVGIDEFLKIFNELNIDPVYLCERLTVCPVKPGANGTVLDVAVQPSSGPHGTTFTIGVAYQVLSELGTAEIAFVVTDPTGTNGFGDAELLVSTAVGNYNAQFQFQATPSEGESFPEGVYQVQVLLCDGACGTKHGSTYNFLTTNFTITAGGSGNSGSITGGSGSGSGAAFY
ncbi:hypothetical protein DICPUDRAFT_33087 [Dictyostelium purpureum]|uniref:Saposin B-type domain-containing protein n=1 Tax=Dictyostelium purpureum TaxID=5786 RepID=F0ZK88_DICPU|nr:uncharacterized protein DICPUDRAFT_33087 [Dictyostelium purpureum]EGC35643.1 hypothetical protein DICPUDRAFT_33087 [Dictyostelium purpureum]|eukprot:XP_003287822.1 hypothetical protein DICPUDRAFT_33087 [Dictyostelium purpureum]